MICDINASLLQYYLVLEEHIRRAPDRQSFVEGITHDIPETDRENFTHELNRPNSWLSKDESYTYIRSMYLANRIRHRCLNAAGCGLEILAQRMPPNIQIDTIYVSNIFEWLKQSSFEIRDQFIRNMTLLKKPGSYFIDAHYLTQASEGTGPPLRISLSLPNYSREKRQHRSRIQTICAAEPSARCADPFELS